MVNINIKNLHMSFSRPDGELKVFENMNLDIEPGQFVAIVGPSGCGKTTLLDLIGDLLKPSKGQILVGGLTPEEARRQKFFSFSFQNPVLLPWKNVKANIQLAGDILQDPKAISRVDEFIDLVGLKGFEHALPSQLSGGMRARVALARALTFDPKVLLLDEPFGALDEMTRLEMNNLLMTVLTKIPATTILVTHSIEEAIYLADRVIVFTKRPAIINEDEPLLVPFKRPRNLATRDSAAFLAIRRKVENLLFGRREFTGTYRTTPEEAKMNNVRESAEGID